MLRARISKQVYDKIVIFAFQELALRGIFSREQQPILLHFVFWGARLRFVRKLSFKSRNSSFGMPKNNINLASDAVIPQRKRPARAVSCFSLDIPRLEFASSCATTHL
jgi:hypothetical protein